MRAYSLLLVLCVNGCAAHGSTSQAKPVAPAPKPVPVAMADAGAESAAPAVATEPELEAQAALSLASAENVPGIGSKDVTLGVIDRAGLVAIVDSGLGRLFQRLQVRPTMKKGRFVGFQITSLHPEWGGSALKAGDVITALNGMPVERPEQAMAAFESLRQADQLVVDLVRDGEPQTLRYRIE